MIASRIETGLHIGFEKGRYIACNMSFGLYSR